MNTIFRLLQTNSTRLVVGSKRNFLLSVSCYNKLDVNPEKLSKINELLEKHKESIYYADYIEHRQLKLGFKRNVIVTRKIQKRIDSELMWKQSQEPLPISLKYLDDNVIINKNESPHERIEESSSLPTQFPFVLKNSEIIEQKSFQETPENNKAFNFDLEVRTRLELYNKSKDHLNWMQDYENYPLQDEAEISEGWTVNYGTSDPHSKISKVPCGGCGALLHCKDTVIPGYIPSEIFKNYNKSGGTHLKEIICQRCHFLNNYDMALQVRVSADDYPKVLRTIGGRKSALVILMVDLLDFPCSIWPGIADLIGYKRPIVVVGNKVDLLPQDGRGYLDRIKNNLENATREAGFGMTNIKHVGLISAKTGFGVEELINKLHTLWQYNGDVFLVGCTNVGKSSLFNALLQSDYCKSNAADLIQRATTSPWPGTTINLLKFPILRPTGWRLYARTQRLISSKKLELQEKKLRMDQYHETKNTKYATLMGHIDRTFPVEEEEVDENKDVFAVSATGKEGRPRIGINERDKEYVTSKWCYDTPGVVQPDQLIHLLTTEELVLTFPKKIIRPRTFSLQPGTTLFIGGLARLDFLEGAQPVRFTVFCSNELPITICKLTKADDMYSEFLDTDLFAVPKKYPERLQLWPGLESSRNFTLTGIDKEISCGDIVLSSAGWVAVTPECGVNCTIQGWTPERRGIYLRDSLLPNAVSFRGKKIRRSCAYRSNQFFIE